MRIFLVVRCRNGYEEHYEEPIIALTSEEEASEYTRRCLEEFHRVAAYNRTLKNEIDRTLNLDERVNFEQWQDPNYRKEFDKKMTERTRMFDERKKIHALDLELAFNAHGWDTDIDYIFYGIDLDSGSNYTNFKRKVITTRKEKHNAK